MERTVQLEVHDRVATITMNRPEASNALTLELARQGRMNEARVYGEKYLATAPPSVYGRDLARVKQLLGR